MVYKWKSGSRIKCDAQVAGEFINDISNKNGSSVTPQDLLDASRPEDTPLHNDFEWRNDIAAEEYRKYQARNIIHSLTIVVEHKDDENKNDESEVRAFFVIKENEKQSYKPIKVIMQDENYEKQLYDSALKELIAIKNKYATIQKLKHIFDEIEKEEKRK